ncbi:interferon phi 1 [Embiotoca jacksoni]|uniref:interferon phi 1 n=1 Tax=Embiotoca jacksoni TaxID=100190 RepID=UPI0037047B3E
MTSPVMTSHSCITAESFLNDQKLHHLHHLHHFIMLLLLLLSVLPSVLCCDLKHFSHLSNNSRTLIELMGGQLTEDRCPVSFPSRLYRHFENSSVEVQLLFIKDSLKMIFGLYRHDNLSSTTWDTVKTRHFLEILDRQIEELNDCVLTDESPDTRLRRYYRRLEKGLHRTGTAYWELLRKETKHHLDRLELLVSSIRTKTQHKH